MRTIYKGHVYIACSIPMYSHPNYENICKKVAEYTGKPVLPAKGMYASTSDWLTKWPKVCKRIDSLVYFADTEGFIGRGTWVEIEDMIGRGKPVMLYDQAQGFLAHTDKLVARHMPGKTWEKYVKVSTDTTTSHLIS